MSTNRMRNLENGRPHAILACNAVQIGSTILNMNREWYILSYANCFLHLYL